MMCVHVPFIPLLLDVELRRCTYPSSHKSSREVGRRGRDVGCHGSPQDVPQNWGETELNRSVIRMVLKTTANDRRDLALCQDEFCRP
ncbi:hypothetical protein TNCV_3743981 [Trichonephila clavipes]|nr:hypothetical protein TNCV_3743981 [Trichonephila clavipes]